MSSHNTSLSARFAIAIGLCLLVGGSLQFAFPVGLIFHTAPDLCLFTAVAVGLLLGPEAGALTGFVGAYLIGANLPFSPGPIYLSHVLAGWFTGALRQRLFTDDLRVAAGAGSIAGLASEVLFFILNPLSPWQCVAGSIAQTLYGLVAGPVIYLILRRFSLASDEQEDMGL